MSISLIANSGIQFYRKVIEINPNEEVVKKSLRFYEFYDTSDYTLKLEFAEKLTSLDLWVSRRSLAEEGFIDDKGNILEDAVNPNLLNIIPEDNRYSINNIELPLEVMGKDWIPLPFFEVDSAENSMSSPTNWCRMRLNFIEKVGQTSRYEVVLAFDTEMLQNKESTEKPFMFENEKSKVYKLSNDPMQTLNFFSESNDCGWVAEYIHKIYLQNEERKLKEDSLKYIAEYIYFVHYLNNKECFPKVKLYSDNNVESIDVDLSIDIGNSRTCVLLFDYVDDKSPLNQVKKLELTDLSNPFLSYDDPFDMRLAFHKADFGEMKSLDSQFIWPSILRLGNEASKLIYSSKNSDEDGGNKQTHHSSPKKYLWDYEPSKRQWEFISLNSDNPIKSIYLEGVSEQFNRDGTLSDDRQFDVQSQYSRRSLMTFVFLEILAHAFRQINSFDFREKHGSHSAPRRIKRIVITCPTAMPLKEQLELRKAAEDANLVLQRFYKKEVEIKDKYGFVKRNLQVIPSTKDLGTDMSSIEDREDWSYDEATCCQLVFVYAEISQRYLNNCKQFFELYGKKRNDLLGYEKKSVTIGSIDIGAGTTDVMISSYKYEDGGKVELTPVPLFWDSFYYAGDDLTKEIIQQILIEGKITDDKYVGSKGLIYNKLIEIGSNRPNQLINDFFGENSARHDYKSKKIRNDFNVQISIPIALNLLERTRKEEKDTVLTFEDFFPTNKPKQEILDYFEEHFGFRFEDIKIKYSLDRMNEIIERVFEPILEKISSLLYAFGCDFVLIAGKPTALKKVEELFLKFYPVSPDRLVTLNNYRVGKWYPFQDGNGYFENHKSIVAVGAMIGLMGGRLDNLENFTLNMDSMKKNMKSTSNFVGIYDTNTKNLSKTYLTPEINRQRIEVRGTPMYLGCRQLDSDSYKSRLLYVFDFDDRNIKDRVTQTLGEASQEKIKDEVERYKTNMKSNMPFKIYITRDYRNNREVLEIESIMDKNGDELSPKYFNMKLQTLLDTDGHWLDTGEFVLNIREK